MRKLALRCGMCLRPLTIPRSRPGRPPIYCQDCAKRRKVEQSRLYMARLRASRRLQGQ